MKTKGLVSSHGLRSEIARRIFQEAISEAMSKASKRVEEFLEFDFRETLSIGQDALCEYHSELHRQVDQMEEPEE